MALNIRPAHPSEYPQIEKMVVESFEPITWFKKIDKTYGPVDGNNWRDRWHYRLAKVFATQTVLVSDLPGDTGPELAAFASGSLERETRLAYLDLLAIDSRFQGRGLGREMLRGVMQYFKREGAVHLRLDCLTSNELGNNLYRAEGFEEVARSIHWFIKIP
jgi:ribosomal protein S18 acetylase RimI-like enzyme